MASGLPREYPWSSCHSPGRTAKRGPVRGSCLRTHARGRFVVGGRSTPSRTLARVAPRHVLLRTREETAVAWFRRSPAAGTHAERGASDLGHLENFVQTRRG